MKMAEFEVVKLYILKAMPTARLEMLFFLEMPAAQEWRLS